MVLEQEISHTFDTLALEESTFVGEGSLANVVELLAPAVVDDGATLANRYRCQRRL